jgi:deoxycytidine triphosphate deaminase
LNLTKHQIKQLNLASPIITEEQYQNVGLDLTLNAVFRHKRTQNIPTTYPDRIKKERVLPEWIEIPLNDVGRVGLVQLNEDGEPFWYLPQGYYKINFEQTVTLPYNIMAIAYPRSTLLRCAVSVQGTVFEPGYSGIPEALVVVHNELGVKLFKSTRVMQLVFSEVDNTEDNVYNGFYQGK